jgi:plastocyanin
MRGSYLRSIALGAAVTFLSVGAATAQWGTLKGRFVYDGKAPAPEKIDTGKEPACAKHAVVYEELVVGADGGLANVVIYVSSKDVKVHPDYEKTAKDTVRYDNKHCRFAPHVMAVRISQTLELHNSDGFAHNSNLSPIRDVAINPLLSPDAKTDYKFEREQKIPVPISCNIHPWMKGYIVVRDDPYVGVSKEDGTFEIVNLPVGELEFTLWHEKVGWLNVGTAKKKGQFKMKIEEGDGNDLGDIKVAPKALEKKKSGEAA